MKVLFVCRANIFRSQIAEAFFNKFTYGNSNLSAASAGTIVGKEGQRLKERTERNVKIIIELMEKEGIDLSENKRKLVTKEMAEKADKIIVMADRNTAPVFLLDNEKVIWWDVNDADENSDYEFFRKSKEKIKKLVRELVAELKE